MRPFRLRDPSDESRFIWEFLLKALQTKQSIIKGEQGDTWGASFPPPILKLFFSQNEILIKSFKVMRGAVSSISAGRLQVALQTHCCFRGNLEEPTASLRIWDEDGDDFRAFPSTGWFREDSPSLRLLFTLNMWKTLMQFNVWPQRWFPAWRSWASLWPWRHEEGSTLIRFWIKWPERSVSLPFDYFRLLLRFPRAVSPNRKEKPDRLLWNGIWVNTVITQACFLIKHNK